jgi:hypothetical protein
MLPVQEYGGFDRFVQSTVQFSAFVTAEETASVNASGPAAFGLMLHSGPSVAVWLTFTFTGPNGPLL